MAVSVTGIAGPGGGTPEKPVGLVFVHAAAPMGERALRLEIPGEREWVRARATATALHLVRRLLEYLTARARRALHARSRARSPARESRHTSRSSLGCTQEASVRSGNVP